MKLKYLTPYFALIFLLIIRLVTMYYIPLNDSTEARYAEIARKMLETHNWVTLWHDYGIPFWAKPPLSTWLSAFSMHLFGVNELAARLPALLLSMAILWLIWDFLKKRLNAEAAMVGTLCLAGSLFFYLDAGAVMTDPALVFCTTLSLIAFWRALDTPSVLWSYVFFIGLGLGLLAKGPVAVLLVGMPIFFFILFTQQWKLLWQRFPWIKGSLLTCLIALPWYILAEQRTPGFLHYFIVGEHLSRFMEPGWTGDKYGFAHSQHYGMIWLYALSGIFPWPIAALWQALLSAKTKKTLSPPKTLSSPRRRGPIPCHAPFEWITPHLPQNDKNKNHWILYLLLWITLPLIFFTFAGNIIYPYVIPCLPAFALLFAELWNPLKFKKSWIISLSTVSGFIFLTTMCLFIFKPEWVEKSQKPIIAAWKREDPLAQNKLIYWKNKTTFSAQFYSRGQVQTILSEQKLVELLSAPGKHFIALDLKDKSEIPAELFKHFKNIVTMKTPRDTIILFTINQGDTP